MKSNRIIALFLLIITLMSFTSCSSAFTGVSVDELVKMEEVNTSPENVCRAYFQSLYQNNQDMFFACFYEGAQNLSDNTNVFEKYQSEIDPELEFLGTKHIATRQCNDDNGYNFDDMKDNITFFNDIETSKIEDIQLVNVKVFFKLGKEYKSLEVYSVVYRVENDWYYFTLMDNTER